MSPNLPATSTTLPAKTAHGPAEEGEFSHQLVVGFFLVSFVFVILFALTQWVLR